MTVHEIADHTHIPDAKVRATVERLTEAGVLEASGNNKGRTYVLSAKVYHDKTAYVRQTDIDAVRYPELVLKLANKKGIISRKDVINLLHVSPSQAYRILQKLENSGELVRDGTRRTAVYHKV